MLDIDPSRVAFLDRLAPAIASLLTTMPTDTQLGALVVCDAWASSAAFHTEYEAGALATMHRWISPHDRASREAATRAFEATRRRIPDEAAVLYVFSYTQLESLVGEMIQRGTPGLSAASMARRGDTTSPAASACWSVTPTIPCSGGSGRTASAAVARAKPTLILHA